MPMGQCKNKFNKTQSNMASWETSYLAKTNPGYPNENEAQEESLNFNILKMIEALKEDFSFKEIQENTFKQVEALKEETKKI